MNTSETHTLSRRHWLAGLVGLACAAGFERGARADAPPTSAQHLIVLWMNGGASHIDTFDPKTGRDAGPFSRIRTRAPGLELCQHLPRLAEQADALAVIRSVTSKEGNHDRARHFAHTGYPPNPTVAHPSFGAWVSKTRGGDGDLPNFVSIGGPSVGGGLLGADHDPFVLRDAGQLPDNVAHGYGVDAPRLSRRRQALRFAEERFAARIAHPALQRHGSAYARAMRMMDSLALSAFDLGQEPAASVAAYGDSDFGRGCLTARRLIEAGVRVVEVTLGGWDTHQDNFTRTQALCGDLDPAMAALIADLRARDRLDDTIVLWMGDFGRTPAINANDGRDHHPQAWSIALAGGGIRGGIVHGATDERGARVVDKPVRLPDLFATVAWQLGIDATQTVYSSTGRPIALTDGGSAIRALIG